MALDESIASAVLSGELPPTLRVYGWQAPSVSLGIFQSFHDIHHSWCDDHGITVVRRPTGGRAILHGDEVTYSFASRNEGAFSGGLYPAFYALSSAFFAGFRILGLDVVMKKHPTPGTVLAGTARCFESVSFGELTVQGKKIIGSAQKRWTDGFMQQGCIPLWVDAELERQVFPRFAETAGRSGLRFWLPDIAPPTIENAIVAGFEAEFQVQLKEAGPSPRELALAERLAEKKYRSAEWTESRGKKRRL